MSPGEKCRDARAIHSGHINISLPNCMASVLPLFHLSRHPLFLLISLLLQVSSSRFSLKRRKGSLMNYLTVRNRSPQKLGIYRRGGGAGGFFWLWHVSLHMGLFPSETWSLTRPFGVIFSHDEELWDALDWSSLQKFMVQRGWTSNPFWLCTLHQQVKLPMATHIADY